MAGGVSENHKKLYKRYGRDLNDIHLATKEILFLGRRQQRDKWITRKRLKLESLEEVGQKLSEEQEKLQVEEATKLLKSGRKVEALTILHRCFAKDPKNAETFIKCEGLPLLQSCLLSTNSELLHAAAWCSINLTAAESSTVQKAMRLSPFLIQFLQGSDSVMQEMCAWAIGNLAGDSQSNKEVLLQQGVIPHLLDLVSTSHHLTVEARTQSVLHALINLARDTSYTCCRCMLENQLFSCVRNLLKSVPAESDLCHEIGWLTGCVYSREETFLEQSHQYWTILNLITGKLMQLSDLPENDWKAKVMIPYLVCCGNMLSLSPDIALLMSDVPSFLPTMKACLSCKSHAVLMKTLWVLINFTAEASCRALVICHSGLVSQIFSLCAERDQELLAEILVLLTAMVRVSSVMNQQLVSQGVLVSLASLISHHSPAVAGKALGVLEALVHNTDPLPSAIPAALKQSLQHLVLASFDKELVERSKSLMQILISHTPSA